MSALLVWYADNRMTLTFGFTDSDGVAATGASLTGTLRPRSGASLWTGALPETETGGTYQVDIAPGDLTTPVVVGRRYLLDVEEASLGYKNTEDVIVETRSDGA